MGEKLIVGPVNKGLKTDRTAFVIDNDSFPVLENSYQWRGRVKRKRGTSTLTRLQRFFNSTSASYNPSNPIIPITLGIGGTGNLFTGFTNLSSISPDENLVLGSITIIDSTGPQTYTDNRLGILIGSLGGSGTINYATGDFTIAGGSGHTVTATFIYYPSLPVMGIEDLVMASSAFPGNIDFDTIYSYNMLNTTPYSAYDVSFYKNPPSAGSYVHKTTVTPTTWNGKNYQQFWTTNYQGALWTTNGINIPFSATNVGMQYAPSSTITFGSQTSTTIVVTITNCPLIIGDFVFFNEWGSSSAANSATLNFQTGYVTAASPNTPPLATKTLTITFPNASIASDTYTPGIIQYLTNRSDVTKDCLRWYDGDPTNGNVLNPSLTGNNGWVNFAPPLLSGPTSNFVISDLSPAQYYLVGARMIIPFKDRLLFLGPVLQTSSSGSQVYLQDTIIYSQNGTPYYTASFQGTATSPTNLTSLLVPTRQTAFPSAYFEDQPGFGGFIAAGVDQPINTVSTNEDVLIIGFSALQTRLAYSGNDLIPFNFFIINAELGSSSTFSYINMDKGVITRGSRGIIITSQTEARRIDLEIPDQVFELDLTNNGIERFCSGRDFINEWIYFTYNTNDLDDTTYIFPNQTLQYNYRDDSWAIFNECYTTYGAFREQTGFTWQTVGTFFATWNEWNEPWNAGSSSLLQPKVVAGNPQGFIILRDEGTGEGNSLFVKSITLSTPIVINSPNHCLNEGDYIIFNGCLGIHGLNGLVYSVGTVTDSSTFTLVGSEEYREPTGTYIGGGLIKRLYVPFIQTKQFPVAWNMGRKTRIGAQQYLLTTTSNSQITLLIFLSQNASSAYNIGSVVPSMNSMNNSLIYTTVLYTCPESTNLGLTPANINLQIPTSEQQLQTWHRMNTSLIGDTVQIGFTMNNDQMMTLTSTGEVVEITAVTNANPCVITFTPSDFEFSLGQTVLIDNVIGMVELNQEIFYISAATINTITLDVDSTSFGVYVSGGTASVVADNNQTAEIELHGFILDVNPSQMLV